MKKRITVLLGILLVIACIAVCTACDDDKAISAYEIAVKNGFTGTEQEWLDSLKGADGFDGQNAADVQFTVEDFYKAAVAKGYTGDFNSFLSEYLNITYTTDSSLAINSALRSAVTVASKFTVVGTDFFGRPVSNSGTSYGAGVIYKLDKEKGDAYIITNFHVVYQYGSTTTDNVSDEISIYTYGVGFVKGADESLYADKKIPARFVGGSAFYDIAVLRVSGSEVLKNSDVAAVKVNYNDVTVGENAYAIGFPDGRGISATGGIVSVDSEYITVDVEGTNSSNANYYYSLRVMRVDTAINSGNSGGGLFDSDGKLIGIVNAKNSSSTVENIGYAIPAPLAVAVADNIIDNCVGTELKGAYRCLIGITTELKESHAEYDSVSGKINIIDTVAVSSLTEGGLVEGKLQVGDILTGVEIKGIKYDVTREYQLREYLMYARVGDTVKIFYTRDGAAGEIEVTFTAEAAEEYFTKKY